MSNLRYPEDVNASDWTALKAFCQQGGIDYTAQRKWLLSNMKESVAMFATVCQRKNGRPTTLPLCYIRTSAIPEFMAHVDSSRIKSAEGSSNVREAQAVQPTLEQRVGAIESSFSEFMRRGMAILEQAQDSQRHGMAILEQAQASQVVLLDLQASIERRLPPAPVDPVLICPPTTEPLPTQPTTRPALVRRVKVSPAADIEAVRDGVLEYSHIIDCPSDQVRYRRAVAHLFGKMQMVKPLPKHSTYLIRAQQAGYGGDPLSWLPKSGHVKLALSCIQSLLSV